MTESTLKEKQLALYNNDTDVLLYQQMALYKFDIAAVTATATAIIPNRDRPIRHRPIIGQPITGA